MAAATTSVEDMNEADFMTLGRWLMGNTKDMELTILMAQLGLACKATSRACAKAGIANLFGMAGDQNSSGDDQKKLDVLSNDIFISALVNSGACSVLGTEADILRTGNDIVAAGYCMYGAATELVMCFKGSGVERFSLDPSLGEFIHTHANVKSPADGGKKIYSCNEGNSPNWDTKILEFIHTHANVKFPEDGG